MRRVLGHPIVALIVALVLAGAPELFPGSRAFGIVMWSLAFTVGLIALAEWQALHLRSPIFRAAPLMSVVPEPSTLPPGLRRGSKSYFSHETVLIAGLAPVTDTAIRELTFEDCTIRGPAVFLVTAPTTADISKFDDCDFHGFGRDAYIVVADANAPLASGIITVSACIFRRCRFEGVSFIGGREDMDALRASPGTQERP